MTEVVNMSPSIDEVDAADLPYATFCEKYMARNRPVLIRNVVDKWLPNVRLWRAPGSKVSSVNGAIHYEYLRQRYGHHDVPVVDGDEEAYGSREYTTMTFAEYLDMVETGNAGMKYLKDWHFVKATQSEPPLYETPEYFQDDWLNWWWDRKDTSGDDYRFVYVGPAGSKTPMHHDVFRSFSWSVNVVGRKEWIFFHPDDESKLNDKFGRSVLADITDPDYDRDLYPHAHEATAMHVTQVSGDAIFVPSGWYHQVKNLEDTISINHNWFNGYSLRDVWTFFKEEYAAVEKELAHLQEIGLQGSDFRDQCQLVMRANTGIDYDEFLALLLAKEEDVEPVIKTEELNWKREAASNQLAMFPVCVLVMTAERILVLEGEVAALQEANDSLYRHHANEKAQMQLAIEQERIQVGELLEANAAFREENDQWRLSYDALEIAKREGEDAWETTRREMEDKITSLEESVKGYTDELVSGLQEMEKEKGEIAARDETIADLQRQLTNTSDRFSQLMGEYDGMAIALEQQANATVAQEQQSTTLEAQLREYVGQLEAQIEEQQTQLQTMSQAGETTKETQHALLRHAQQETADKDKEMARLTQRIAQLVEEVSLLSLTVGASGDGKSGANVMTTLRELQQLLFQKSEQRVQQGEQHLQLGIKLEKHRQLHQSLQLEVDTVRCTLLKGIVGEGVDGSAYQHVKLAELVRLRLKAVENELRILNGTNKTSTTCDGSDEQLTADGEEGDDNAERPSTHLANVESFSAVDSFGAVGRLERELRLAKSRNKRLQLHAEQLERDLVVAMKNLDEFPALKEKMVEIVSRERVEKELRVKADFNFKEATDKIAALSEHIEKLMVHLKHEAAAKTKAVDLQRRTDKELTECKEKLAIMTKKNTVKDQQIQELEQGAKILEDQLRLMDERFIDVRNKLDWTRATSQKEMKRLQSELNALRMKWQMASDMGTLTSLPDWVSTPTIKSKSKPLGASSSDSRLVTIGSNNNPPTMTSSSLSPLRNLLGADPLTMRYEIPKLPQQDSEAGTPWSDAKLGALQRQLLEKRKL